jgi:hypothetical protein
MAERSIAGRGAAGLAALFSLVLLGGPAAALEGSQECPTWFPDFRCERHGRYEGFVMPMQMPYLFEDPFITTGLSLFGIWHDFPQGSVMQGGELWLLALQARVAITDRLAFIATKDGFTWQEPGNPVLDDEEGFYDITAGFKYALIDRPEDGFILSPSVRFDIPVGQDEVFQGNGDGEFIPTLSAAWGLGDFHVIGDVGGRIPFDGDAETTQFYWNLHLDYALLPFFVPFVEAGGLHYTSGGDGSFGVVTSGGEVPLAAIQATTGPFDAVDVGNIGGVGMAGDSIVIFTVGARFPITQHLMLGGSYDFPVSSQEDIFNQRATLNVTLEF